MRIFSPNCNKEDGLETVLEVPIPEEMVASMGSIHSLQYLRCFMKAEPSADKSSHLSATSNKEFMALLKLGGSPLIPFQVQSDKLLTRPIKDCSIEASTAKYIVQQYVAATGGSAALNSVISMYAMGQVNMVASEMQQGEDSIHTKGNPEVGGFVLWQKNPDMWYLELVVSGFKVSAGSDGTVAWNQCSSQPSHANKGPPRPLRRSFQGLDPRYVANLFLEASCVGDNCVNNEDCFLLKLETAHHILKAQSTPQTEIIRHTIFGYFSQRTGLLVKFADTKLVKVKPAKGNESVLWETSIESVIEEYSYVDGINIAHAGKTVTMLYRHGEARSHKRKIEEAWKIEEVDFNICGLSMDCFLPPADVKKKQDGGDGEMAESRVGVFIGYLLQLPEAGEVISSDNTNSHS